MYSLDGELNLTTVAVEIKEGIALPARAGDIYIDSEKRAYHQSAIELDENGKKTICLLDGEQVEILLKLLGIVNG
jgi:hypothetical protein